MCIPNYCQNSRKGFIDADKLAFKFIWENIEPKVHKTILREKKVEGDSQPHLKDYSIATIVKTVHYCWKDRHTDQ